LLSNINHKTLTAKKKLFFLNKFKATGNLAKTKQKQNKKERKTKKYALVHQ